MENCQKGGPLCEKKKRRRRKQPRGFIFKKASREREGGGEKI
jgi:hypothetical protein